MAGVILVLTLVGQGSVPFFLIMITGSCQLTFSCRSAFAKPAIIGIILYRSWASINKLLRQNPLGNSSEKGGARLNFITLALLFRVAVFMLCVLAALMYVVISRFQQANMY